MGGFLLQVDTKADNVLIDWEEHQDGIIVERVQLADLEDAAYIPPGSHIIGKQVGNGMWRSPKAHTSKSTNKSSDIFSFALVVSFYAQELLHLEVVAHHCYHVVHLRSP
jgi:serine/threonine protein kinase